MKRRILAFFVVLILAGFTAGMKIASSPAVDQWLRRSMVEQAARHLGVRLEMGSLERNIILTRITLTDVTLEDLKGTGASITVSRLAVSIDPYAFFRGKLRISDLKLEGMVLDVERRVDGSVAVDPLFPFWRTGNGGPGGSLALGLEIGNVALVDVSLSYRDHPADLTVNLQDVVILLVRTRFDLPDRRTVSLRAKEGEIGWRVFPSGRRVAVDSLSAEMAVTPRELRVSSLAVNTGPLSLKLAGTLPFMQGLPLDGDLSLAVDIGKLPWLIPDSGGRIDLEGSLSGDLISPVFKGQLSARQVRLGGRVLERVRTDVRLDPHGCTLSGGRILYRGEELSAEVDMEFRRLLPFVMRMQTDRYPLPKLLEEVGGGDALSGGDVSTEVMIAGRLSGVASTVRMSGELRVPLGEGELRTMEFGLSGRYEAGSMKNLLLTARSEPMELVLSGNLSGKGPELDLSITDSRLANWARVPGLEELGGSFTLKGSAGGNWEDVSASLDLELEQPAWRRYRADRLEAHLDVDRSGIGVPMMALKKGSSVLVGRFQWPWNGKGMPPWFSVSIAGGRAEDILDSAGVDFDMAGGLEGTLSGTRSDGEWTGSGAISLSSGRVLREPFDELALEGAFRSGLLTLERIVLNKEGGRLEGHGSIGRDGYRLSVRSTDPLDLGDVEYLRLIHVPLQGEVSLTGEMEGKPGGEPSAAVDLSWDHITFDGRSWRSGMGTFLFRGPKLEARAQLHDGDFSAVASVDLRGDIPFSGTIHTPQGVDRSGINDLLGLGIPGSVISGRISARADASGILTSVRQAQVEGVISEARFSVNGVGFTSREGIPFSYFSETGIRFHELPLRSGGSAVNGALRIAPDAGLEGSVEGSVDLTGLTFLEPTVDSFVGSAVIKMKVTGRLHEPVLNGTIDIVDTSCVAHLPFDLPVDQLEGRLEIVGNRLHVVQIRGEPETGTLEMSGEIYMSGFKPVQGALRWNGEGVTIRFPEGLETVDRADLELKFAEGKGFLRGTVTMDQGTFVRDVDLDNLIALIGERAADGDGERPPRNGRGEGDWLGLDIDMVTAAPLAVDIKLLRGQAVGELHLRGTAGRPVLSGRLEMSEGVIEYRGHIFEVLSGTVAFLNPSRIEPNFDFSARTEVTGFDREGNVTDYTVELLATGVPDKFQLDLVSVPVLSEVDIVALLTWGAVGEQAFASRGGLSAAEATLLLTRELKGRLETEVERVTGFDRFTINPSAVSASGERTTRIQVDKKLSDNFYLTYSTPILASEEQEVTVKYRLSRSLSLVGEQKGEEDYGLDLDFQFEIP